MSQQQKLNEEMKNEDRRQYTQFNNSNPIIQNHKVDGHANNNDNLSKSAPSDSWVEEQIKPATKHKRGASSSDILKNTNNASVSSSSNIEPMIRRLSLNEKEGAVAMGSNRSGGSNKHGTRTSNNDSINRHPDDYSHSRPRQMTSIPPPPPIPEFYDFSRQQPYHQPRYHQKRNPEYIDDMRSYSSPSMRAPPAMPLRMDQMSIQEVHAIIEENISLRNELEAMMHQFQMERLDLQRRLRHITARVQYLEKIKKSANSPEEMWNEIKKPYPTSSTSSRRHLHYNISHSNSNRRRRQQISKPSPHHNDEEVCVTSTDELESPDGGYHNSETNKNNNNDNQKRRASPCDSLRRLSFDDHQQQQQKPFYAHCDMMESNHHGAYMMPPPPYPMFSAPNSNRSMFEDDKQHHHMYMRHYYEHSPYSAGYSDEEQENNKMDPIRANNRDRSQMIEDDEQAAAAMNDFYNHQRVPYGPPLPPSMHPGPPPLGPFMSGPPPHPPLMQAPPPMNYGRQHHQGHPPPSWIVNDLSSYPELPRSRRSSIHRNTSVNKHMKKPYKTTNEELEEQEERMFIHLQQQQPFYGEVNEDEENMQMLFHQRSMNGPPPPGMMGGPPPHPGVMGGPPPPPPPPPRPVMNIYGELVLPPPPPPPPPPFNGKHHHAPGGEGSLRRVSSRRSVPGGLGNGTGAINPGLGSRRSSYISTR